MSPLPRCSTRRCNRSASAGCARCAAASRRFSIIHTRSTTTSRLPSFLLRGNPASYHRYFKEAGFVTEKGQVDYTAPLTPEILARYRRMAEAAAMRRRYDSKLARVRISGRDRRMDRRDQRGVRSPLGMESRDARGSAPDAHVAVGDSGRRPLDARDNRRRVRRRGLLGARSESRRWRACAAACGSIPNAAAARAAR